MSGVIRAKRVTTTRSAELADSSAKDKKNKLQCVQIGGYLYHDPDNNWVLSNYWPKHGLNGTVSDRYECLGKLSADGQSILPLEEADLVRLHSYEMVADSGPCPIKVATTIHQVTSRFIFE